MHTHPRGKTMESVTETSAAIMGFSICEANVSYEHDGKVELNMRKAFLTEIFYSSVFLSSDRLSRTHWLITWFHHIYKISKSNCILSYPWLQILPCNIKREEKYGQKCQLISLSEVLVDKAKSPTLFSSRFCSKSSLNSCARIIH